VDICGGDEGASEGAIPEKPISLSLYGGCEVVSPSWLVVVVEENHLPQKIAFAPPPPLFPQRRHLDSPYSILSGAGSHLPAGKKNSP
jgi:hypothetical protein